MHPNQDHLHFTLVLIGFCAHFLFVYVNLFNEKWKEIKNLNKLFKIHENGKYKYEWERDNINCHALFHCLLQNVNGTGNEARITNHFKTEFE